LVAKKTLEYLGKRLKILSTSAFDHDRD